MHPANIGPQFIDHTELAKMYSNDFSVPMSKAFHEMDSEFRHITAYADPSELSEYGIHEKDIEHGSPRKYIDHLKADIAKNGITTPLTVRGGNNVIDGNHRAIAALELRLPRIPITEVQ